MNKKIKSVLSLVLLIASIFTFLVKPVLAEEETPQLVATDSQEVNIYMFRGDGCTYCAKALTWFEEIEAEEGKYFNLITYEVWNDEENKALMDRVANYMKDDVSGVPYIIVGKKTYTGFDDSYKEGAPDYAPIDNEEMRLRATGEYITNASVFEESCNVFMPWYRQVGMKYAGVVSKKYGTIEAGFDAEPYTDIKAALDYYFEKCNNGRPFIIAGHSQGSAMVKHVLKNQGTPRLLQAHGGRLRHWLLHY